MSAGAWIVAAAVYAGSVLLSYRIGVLHGGVRCGRNMHPDSEMSA